jgi:hypothetical protein
MTDGAAVDAESKFWHFNVGHVLLLGGMIFSGLYQGAKVLGQYNSMQFELREEHETIIQLKNAMDEVRAWRNQEADRDMAWRNEVSAHFTDVEKHLDRLDAFAGQHAWQPMRPGR